MDNYIVYMHINKANRKKYIGITCNRPCIRWHRGGGYRDQKRFYNAIKCYGWDGFEHIILRQGLSKREAEKEEEFLIAKYESNDMRYGYNIENGGIIHKLSEEQKRHLSEIHLGKKHSEETKAKMSEIRKKIGAPWMNGKKHSKETIEKMKESRSGVNNPRAKEVYQYDLKGNFIRKFEYMDIVKEVLGIKSTAHISQCCSGDRKSAHGFMWSYFFEEKEPYFVRRKGGGIWRVTE